MLLAAIQQEQQQQQQQQQRDDEEEGGQILRQEPGNELGLDPLRAQPQPPRSGSRRQRDGGLAQGDPCRAPNPVLQGDRDPRDPGAGGNFGFGQRREYNQVVRAREGLLINDRLYPTADAFYRMMVALGPGAGEVMRHPSNPPDANGRWFRGRYYGFGDDNGPRVLQPNFTWQQLAQWMDEHPNEVINQWMTPYPADVDITTNDRGPAPMRQ